MIQQLGLKVLARTSFPTLIAEGKQRELVPVELAGSQGGTVVDIFDNKLVDRVAAAHGNNRGGEEVLEEDPDSCMTASTWAVET